MRQTDQDWLANGLDGRSAKTIKKNENVLEPILKVIGTRKLRALTAGDVRQALSTMAAEYSSSAVTMGHLALKRAIRHAEANDLVSRNVAALVDTPEGLEGRPSKSLSLEQAVAVITAARSLPVLELRPGLKDVRRPAERRRGSSAPGPGPAELERLQAVWLNIPLAPDPGHRRE